MTRSQISRCIVSFQPSIIDSFRDAVVVIRILQDDLSGKLRILEEPARGLLHWWQEATRRDQSAFPIQESDDF